jgi:hypothetical protein
VGAISGEINRMVEEWQFRMSINVRAGGKFTNVQKKVEWANVVDNASFERS